jgi:thioester reductase-like protein
MSTKPGIFLTGATGLLGRYLLRDLLASGRRVAVLIRDGKEQTAAERLEELLDFGSESVGRTLPRPLLLEGDLRAPGLGLGAAGWRWLADEAGAVIHSAACVSFQQRTDGEPWETNVNGTRRLLELCRSLGVIEVHYISTAFACGDYSGAVLEDESNIGNGSRNAYERSKAAAEQVVREFPGIRAAVYRPSVVVGDSRTGYTSTYHHFYRFLELAVRLSPQPPSAGTAKKPRRQPLSLRLPLTGEEWQNFVSVDWVSRALIELIRQPRRHGRTYHLVARRSVRLREVAAALQDLMGLEGIEWVGPHGLPDPTSVEQMVLDRFPDYWPYLRGNLTFDCRNTHAALPYLPPPPFDQAMVARLLRFAQEDGWGRRRSHSRPVRAVGVARYLEDVLPAQMRESPLASALPSGLLFAVDIHGPGGGQWSYRCGVRILSVQRELAADRALTFRLDAPTLESLMSGRQTAQQAFFEGRIDIDGDTEKALKLAMLIEQFLAERADRSPQPMKERHAAVGN